jgi:hypothetical protein
MTVRDLGTAAAGVTDDRTVREIYRLGVLVDEALWSGLWSGQGETESKAEEAWSIVRAVRRGLARSGRSRRLRAFFDHRGLRRPH